MPAAERQAPTTGEWSPFGAAAQPAADPSPSWENAPPTAGRATGQANRNPQPAFRPAASHHSTPDPASERIIVKGNPLSWLWPIPFGLLGIGFVLAGANVRHHADQKYATGLLLLAICLTLVVCCVVARRRRSGQNVIVEQGGLRRPVSFWWIVVPLIPALAFRIAGYSLIFGTIAIFLFLWAAYSRIGGKRPATDVPEGMKHAGIRGSVRNFSPRSEARWYVWNWVIRSVDQLGNPLREVAVEMRAHSISGFLSDGDEVEVTHGRDNGNLLLPTRVFNHTTQSWIEAEQIPGLKLLFWFLLIVTCFLLLPFLFYMIFIK